MRLITIFAVLFMSVFVSAQDTTFSRIDTILCTANEGGAMLVSPYDSDVFLIQWMMIGSQDTIIEASINVEKGDAFLLVSSYLDASVSDSIFIDSFFINVRVKPIVDFLIPAPTCYDGSDIEIKDFSNYFNSDISSIYSNQNGILNTIDSTFVFSVGNGEVVSFRVFYEDTDCPSHTIDTLIEYSTLLQPTASFQFEKTCENESLTIQNMSNGIVGSSEFIFFESGQEIGDFMDAATFILPDTLADGMYSILGVVDNNNGCLDTIESNVVIDSVTYVSFDNLLDQYCAMQDLSLLEANIVGGEFSGVGVTDLGNGTASYAPTTSGSNIEISYTYVNTLQCSDTDIQFVSNVFDRPDLILSNLLPEYCEKDPSVSLEINQSIEANSMYDVIRDGQFFDSETGIEYSFDLDIPGDYLFENTYEDQNGCRDTIFNNTIVHPLPEIDLDSLNVIVPGDFITLVEDGSAEVGVSYIWSNGSTEHSIEVGQPGIYTLSAINDVTGCGLSDTIRVEYDATIETTLLEISIAPNPTQDFITLSMNQIVSGIRLVNVFGNSVMINEMSEFTTGADGELTLSLANQASGYYYLLIPDVGNFLIVKL